MDVLLDTVNVSLSVAVGVGTLCFLLYWFIAHSELFKRYLTKVIPQNSVELYLPFFQKGLGTLLIGIVPGLLLWIFKSQFPGDYGLVLESPRITLIWIASFGTILFFVPFFSARKSEMQAFYPQIRIAEWDIKLLAINILVWAIYLFSYEFLFRSFLLNSLLISLDITSAIILTTAISVATHIPKGAAETFGTIPFSVMLCLAMVFTGSIWAGFFIHLILALSNDTWALYFNPEMRIKKNSLMTSES